MRIVEINGRWEYVYSQEEVDRARRYGFTAEDVAFTESYYPNGAYFILIKESTTTDAQIEAAKKYLYERRDVVGIGIGIVEAQNDPA